MAMPGIRRITARVFALFLLSGISPLQSEGAVWFVTQNGAGTKHGGSWTNAMGESEFVQTLKLVQPAGTEFWIAKGTYRPTADPNNRDATFVLKNGVALYGGFAGNETHRKERDWDANPTTLSGRSRMTGLSGTTAYMWSSPRPARTRRPSWTASSLREGTPTEEPFRIPTAEG